MNAVACNSCGRVIGPKVMSSIIRKTELTLPAFHQPAKTWRIQIDDIIAKGIDPSRVHFCQPCFAKAIIAKLHKMMPALEREGGAV